jgi:hypothetical protein
MYFFLGVSALSPFYTRTHKHDDVIMTSSFSRRESVHNSIEGYDVINTSFC